MKPATFKMNKSFRKPLVVTVSIAATSDGVHFPLIRREQCIEISPRVDAMIPRTPTILF
ncbi:hypothetical protein V7x_26070 [Crateriforma conspicua]|uniref:Uncharacterized protein n=1 Tax=Crateriforma conspicua TaxID=2527996 RepID=A0A5C6FZK0_9PLAN|nr:hypothetical protein V7x_26070 [Crateriforma conspicua]